MAIHWLAAHSHRKSEIRWRLVRMRGLEPPRGYPRSHLKAVRLPISPHPRDFTTPERTSSNYYLNLFIPLDPTRLHSLTSHRTV
jgi:hypothetical protein